MLEKRENIIVRLFLLVIQFLKIFVEEGDFLGMFFLDEELVVLVIKVFSVLVRIVIVNFRKIFVSFVINIVVGIEVFLIVSL